MEAEATDPLGPLTEEEKDWWRRFRLWLKEMEKKRMTWQDTIRHMAELRELNPEVADMIEANNAMARGDLEAPEGVNLIEATPTDIKAILDYERRMKQLKDEEEELQKVIDDTAAEALAEYYGDESNG